VPDMRNSTERRAKEVFDGVEISGRKVKLKGSKIVRKVNRDNVVRSVPFKHYERS